jgi:predicted metal-dependent peptidase
MARERLKDYIKKAAQEASATSQGWGTVPSDVRRDILSKLKSVVDWKKVLRYFVKTSTRANKTSTVKRLNKRYRYIHAGKKVKRMARIAVSIDQSGSVDDSMLEAFFAELNKLAKLATFTVVPFDTRVEEALVYEWKKGQAHKTERVMRGGTDFNAPTEYVNKKGFDGHIILTDLMAPKPKPSKCQRMWMTTKQYAARPYFQTNERILTIDCN